MFVKFESPAKTESAVSLFGQKEAMDIHRNQSGLVSPSHIHKVQVHTLIIFV